MWHGFFFTKINLAISIHRQNEILRASKSGGTALKELSRYALLFVSCPLRRRRKKARSVCVCLYQQLIKADSSPIHLHLLCLLVSQSLPTQCCVCLLLVLLLLLLLLVFFHQLATPSNGLPNQRKKKKKEPSAKTKSGLQAMHQLA